MVISRRTLLRQIGASVAMTPVFAAHSLDALPISGAGQAEKAARPAGPVRLDRNENAYGPSPKVAAAIREAAANLENLRAHAEADALRQRIAIAHAVRPEQVILGCGAQDVLRMAAEAFAGPAKNIICARPTFDAVADIATRAGSQAVAVPLTRTYAHDLGAMLARTDGRTGLVYLCTPNNPTGSLTPRADLEAFLTKLSPSTYVVVDEAYHHYVSESSEYASFIERPVDDPRVMVLRSFSKIYGLAGMRVGYAIAAPETARLLAARSLSEPVGVVAARAAAAALEDAQYVRMSARRNADDRQQFLNQANARMVRAIDSHANFVMLNAERPSAPIVEHLRAHQVVVAGPFAGFEAHLRVSLGLPAEIKEFWRAWDLLPGHKM